MKYIAPAIKIEEAQATIMIADSLKIIDNGITVDGGDAKTKVFNAWDIWGEE